MSAEALSVSQLTKYIKAKFDTDKHLRDVLLEGEISNFKRNVSGHFYFTLKDEHAQISAVMFRSHATRVDFAPKEGDRVHARGYLSVYERSGQYQIYCQTLSPVGEGDLYRAYLKLKETLRKEGLFDTHHKQALPRFPKQIAVITSRTGAAVRDIIQIINRRYPLVKILVYPTVVQGENAPRAIVDNLIRADQNPDNDVIIVGRGGGSIEDLWAFNDETVARTIHAATTPIISAVGHETDETIVDFVSDTRAPTPSGAAELVVPDRETLRRDINQHQSRVYDAVNRLAKLKKDAYARLETRHVMRDPLRLIMPHERAFTHLYDTLRLVHPQRRLDDVKTKVHDKNLSLNNAHKRLLERKREQLRALSDTLRHVSPVAIMEKGYVLVRKHDKLIKNVRELSAGDAIHIAFHDGKATSTVTSIEKDDDHER